MSNVFEFGAALTQKSRECEEMCLPYFKKIERIAESNSRKVLKAFIENGVAEADLGISTGYGYSDRGRDKLDAVCAAAFGAEDAIIRHSFASGTHTLSVALFGILRPGDTMLCVTGRPYDTLLGVLGIDGESNGSLAEFGVKYDEVALTKQGKADIPAIKEKLKNNTYKMVYIQRSRGYSLRKSLSIQKIAEIVKAVREINKTAVIMVDNCYGEFVEETEPVAVGADLMAGSLIKNPGGGIAPCGGYIAGKKEYVEQCSYRMTCAGVGREVGATLGHNRELYMGFYNAPHAVGEALKTAVFAACLFKSFGYTVTPEFDEPRADIIEAIVLGSENPLISFCKGLQKGSPIDSFVSPEPSSMPGYANKVIMAAGTFTLGSSIELSADAPLREPYAVWMQGGINYATAKLGILSAADEMIKNGLLIL